ncbi:techylectin-5A-like [Penaeus chinensis]|uniref:techylectin-5A-like n=1 Tax=Penaeus chinensis TaxID=139456 RepID=UPI001FB5AE51|nr:techylectin-5A-like [Penaeus chinensis]
MSVPDFLNNFTALLKLIWVDLLYGQAQSVDVARVCHTSVGQRHAPTGCMRCTPCVTVVFNLFPRELQQTNGCGKHKKQVRQDCLVPRDCANVLRLGINETGRYRIIPSGDAHGDQIEVWCDLDADGYDPSGGGWTTALRRDPAGSNFAGHTLDWHRSAQLFPDRNAADKDFFIGLDNLVQLNRHPNGTVRPLVFQFLLEVANEPLFHATYDSVVLGEGPGFTLLEVGHFHGNAVLV